MPKWLPKGSKIELGAPWGSIFEVLGGFWTMSNFDEFWGRQKVSQKSYKFDTWVAKGEFQENFREAWRNEQGCRGDFWGVRRTSKACKTWNWAKSSRNLELGVWQELQFLFSTHCSPSRTGAADSSHARTPPGLNKNKWHGHVNRFCLIDAWISLKDRIAGFVVRCGFAALLILRVSGLKFLENVIKKRRRNSVNND